MKMDLVSIAIPQEILNINKMHKSMKPKSDSASGLLSLL